MSDTLDIEVMWSIRSFDTKSNDLNSRIILRLAISKDSSQAINLDVSVHVSQSTYLTISINLYIFIYVIKYKLKPNTNVSQKINSIVLQIKLLLII